MKQLYFICAQPTTLYYAWQVEVMINNFIDMGVDLSHVDIVCAKTTEEIPKEWLALSKTYAARFFFYEDTRQEKEYISSIRPNVLKQHWKNHPTLQNQAIFYHDCDIIFTKNPNTWILDYMINDNKWYGSNTISYIGYNYIKSKGSEVLDRMLELMQLPEELIKVNAINSIGAQYLLKNLTYEYWDRVEKDCELLFKDITFLNKRLTTIEDVKWEQNKFKWEQENKELIERGISYPVEKYNSLQIWCADMWAVLWGGWRLGYETICAPEFEFSWAPYDLSIFEKCNIMHNAGVINPNQGLFYKSIYLNKLPYNETIEVLPNTASKKYWDYVVEVGKRSCLLEKDLEIIKITYGNKDISDTISKNTLSPIKLYASNTVYGDPLPDIVKTLQVTYRTKYGICFKEISEDDTFTITNEDKPISNNSILSNAIKKDSHNIFFFWEGYIHGKRLKLLEDCIYSTRLFNPDRPIYVISNTLNANTFEDKFKIQVIKWDYTFFDECGISIDFLIKNYFNTSPRELSDIMRLVLLHKFGGSYVDTDDIAIASIGETKNIICRSYDPHTSFYNHILPEQCVPGKYREIPGYDYLNMFPRNDCWQNFEPGHYLIYELLNHPKIKNTNKAVHITDEFSWQSLINEIIVKYQDRIGIDFNYRLTLLYLYEDFVAGSSLYDLGRMGGELHDVYNKLPNIGNYSWGNYKCTKEIGEDFYNLIISKYPNLSHMWLHSKEAKSEWFMELDYSKEYSISTWIYDKIRQKIKEYVNIQFSVIIPTLWYSDRIFKLLEDLERCNEVGEIILIDNNNKCPILNNSKLKVISTNTNSYVNPAWNIGVEFAKYEYIALCNDDINFNTDVFSTLLIPLKSYGIIGQSTNNYYLKEEMEIASVTPLTTRPSGWGCLIFTTKSNWKPIPSFLKIACGDDYLIDNISNPGILSNFKVESEISTTSIRGEFFSTQEQDAQLYKKYKYGKTSISVLTLTYQRHELLEEAIQSFLLQDFSGDSEMVIINDCPEVKYYIDHPKIKIINCSTRFSSIGKKLEYGYKQCKYEYIYRLDDDDLLAPNALQLASTIIVDNPNYEIYRTEKYYYFLNNTFVDIVANTNTGNIFTKEYLNRIKFPDKNVGEDFDILYNHNANIKTESNKGSTMIYRWGNQTYNISAMPDNKVMELTNNSINTKEKGIIVLFPSFKKDYYAQLK